MNNFMNQLLDDISENVNVLMDKYEIVQSGTWNPTEEAPSKFIELFMILKYLNVEMNAIDLEILKASCVGDERVYFGMSESISVRYTVNVRNLINYLIKNGFYKIPKDSNWIYLYSKREIEYLNVQQVT